MGVGQYKSEIKKKQVWKFSTSDGSSNFRISVILFYTFRGRNSYLSYVNCILKSIINNLSIEEVNERFQLIQMILETYVWKFLNYELINIKFCIIAINC